MTKPIYQDPTQPIEARISDLIPRMTLEEKVRQLDMYAWGEVADQQPDGMVFNKEKLDAVIGNLGMGCLQSRNSTAEFNNAIQEHVKSTSRLGIPVLVAEEALHGLNRRDCTIFPQQITLAATWEPSLAYKQGHDIARETRSLGIHETFSPVLDLGRDPRWGRVEEGFGEDTYLSAAFAGQIVKGLQGDDVSAPDRIVAEPKHFTGYGQPVGGLNCAPAAMGRHEHYAYCIPVFEAAFNAGALNAMCSYSSIDGVPVSGDHEMLTDVLRGKLGMKGLVRADMTAVKMLYTSHHVAKDNREALKMGLLAGVDMQFYDFTHEFYQDTMIDLVRTGEVPEAAVDLAVSRVLRVKFLLGLFENTHTDPALFAKTARCAAHKETALNVARKAMTLLKNDGILPLSKDINTIAVLGPSADTPRMGDYTAPHNKADAITLLDGIRSVVSPSTKVLHSRGCNILDAVIKPFRTEMLQTLTGEPGLLGEYFNNSDMSGEPALVRVDDNINFNWWFSPPGDGVNANQYSIRWTGRLVPTQDMDFDIGLSTMDSMRLFIDGGLIVDAWDHNDAMTMLATFPLKKGQTYDVQVEFRNKARGGRVIFGYSQGDLDMTEAINMARQADVAIVAVGDSEQTCGENLDRTDLNLPGQQLALVKAIYETGTPVVLVLQNGRPLTLRWENEHIPAILEAWFPGEMGGQAMAEALFGDINPAGRLPFSFPKSIGQIPLHYSRKPAGGLRYVEMDYHPLFHFGHGLSYTTFAYENLRLSAEKIPANGQVQVTFDVINTGNVAGEEVPQLYVNDVVTSVVTGTKELKGFDRIALEPGERKTVTLTLGFDELRLLNRDYEWVVEPGLFKVMVGASNDDIRLFGEFSVI
ncbi:MAG: glycoside hydrolase family 3 C-terminal domain-containing protein [Defluviitaleaceae bacterium]|nr:glycoside hydrolase family 3 C-terminal domain-containing protein [Defluviitaleaceae bacterium]